MGHGHHQQEFKVPDFRKYLVEDVPDLMETKRKLAALGLKDPWLRNEVWKYQIGPTYKNNFGVFLQIMSRGFRYGLVIAVVATAISKTFARKIEHH